VAVACTLIVAKAIAWWLSGSVSMLAGLTDSALDGVTSLLNLLAVHYALRPADDDHRYGHGKAESLAGMAQALFIGGSAVLIAMQAFERIKHPEPVGAPWMSIGVIVFSLVLTLALLMLQHRVVKATGSNAVRADSCTTARTCCSTAASWWRWYWPGLAGIRSTPGSAWASPRTFSGARCRSPGKVSRC
jgi:cation diffusion facilitator family transporter